MAVPCELHVSAFAGEKAASCNNVAERMFDGLSDADARRLEDSLDDMVVVGEPEVGPSGIGEILAVVAEPSDAEGLSETARSGCK